MKTLFVAWQDPISRSWFPIGRLTFDGQRYQFLYIKGALDAQKQCGFSGVWALRDFYQVYESAELPPLFANRVMRRPPQGGALALRAPIIPILSGI